ncbi:glycosyltransferase family 25 protein [Helicobacter kayseriensis]|uniref:glycosyltransferase family 25 protein n=1 Tax=Helicobacter kayseriensis TaxID=2905877 RepID=UPI001E3CC15F|nr:glycosyltransferase family 25 protein [Helicobacter kayseriensis]MCE3047671.1 glycosyltransferase family 25 protein [Helicobacter kayseriensis]MCE3049091.1 glycosyltransferase family 25 protein [Helicobacter kayseriensis]
MFQAFIINLSQAEERKTLMQKQIQKFQDIDFIFFDAISVGSREFLSYRQKWDCDFLTKIYRGKTLTDGEKACFASHYALWQKCIELNRPILILEDDVLFFEDFEIKVKDLFLNPRWQFVRLMPLFKKRSVHIEGDLYQVLEGVCGTQGYFLTPRAALAFVQKAKLWFCPVDNFLDKAYWHGIRTFFFSPPIIAENSALQSCIDSVGKRELRKVQKTFFGYKITKECLNALEWIWRKYDEWTKSNK